MASPPALRTVAGKRGDGAATARTAFRNCWHNLARKHDHKQRHRHPGLLAGVEGDWPPLVAWLVVLAFILVGCEVLPKTLAVRTPEQWAVRVARPMLFLQGTTGWFQQLVQQFNAWLLRVLVPRATRSQTNLSDEEYQELLELAYQQGALAKSEKEIILQIISLDRYTAKDVMQPLSRMAAISDDLSIEEMLAAARKHKHRRLPVYDQTPDTIVGLLNTLALLLDPHRDLDEVIDSPPSCRKA